MSVTTCASKHTVKRSLVLSLAAVTGALLLAACGGNDKGKDSDAAGGSASTPSAPASIQAATFNDADVTFAQMMIPHHQQALEMAKLAPGKASSPTVKELAAKIEAAQDPEITMMKSWLSAWGKPAPAGTDMGHGMPGMMSMDDMMKLQGATGPEFDKMFLQMMIHHHNGAIEMAEDEQAKGTNPDAKSLAERIASSQAAEVAQMTQLLNG